MASICLYDIDFLYGSRFVPNLELMKVFNYYYQLGHIVNLGQKKEDLGRYNQIVYFKNSPKVKLPNNIKFDYKKSQFYGYGFYGKFTPLNDKYKDIKPNYLIYDLFYDKIKNKSKYDRIKEGSLIRLENEDFTNFSKENKHIYITDYNIIKLKNSYNFLKEHNLNYSIHYLFQQKIDNREDFEKFFFSFSTDSKPLAAFDYDINFFKKYYNENVSFLLQQKKNETQVDFLRRIIKMILFAKNNNQTLTLYSDLEVNSITKQQFPLLELLLPLCQWANNKTQLPFYDYFTENKTAEKAIKLSKEYSSIRLLLKQDPTTFNTKEFDF